MWNNKGKALPFRRIDVLKVPKEIKCNVAVDLVIMTPSGKALSKEDEEIHETEAPESITASVLSFPIEILVVGTSLHVTVF